MNIYESNNWVMVKLFKDVEFTMQIVFKKVTKYDQQIWVTTKIRIEY